MESHSRILVVDDTRANLDVLCELLEAEGYTVSLAPNGDVALRIAGRSAPDLVLLDVMMPGIDGFEVCRRLKANAATRDVPVIFITAEDTAESVLCGFEVGGIDYIKKPFNDGEVLARVRTHLQIDRLSRELAQKNVLLEEANAQIQHAIDRKSRFVSNVSHEFRTPLTAIKGHSDNLVDGLYGDLSDKQEKNIHRVRANADRLLAMVNDLLDLSKIDAEAMDLDIAPVGLEELLESCCDDVAPLVSADVRLAADVEEGMPLLRTDPERLRQILTNLLSNAAKFTESGSIEVRAHCDKDTVEIAVSDTGIGIPEESLGTIFEEFRQVKGSDPSLKGTGLGLSIVLASVKLLGGSVDLESKVGVGTTFTIRIPENATNRAPQQETASHETAATM